MSFIGIMNGQIEQSQEHLVKHGMRTIDMLRLRKVKRQPLRQFLLWSLVSITTLRLPKAEILVAQVAVVLSETAEHGRYPDPVLEENAGDLDEVARAAVLMLGVGDEFVDCMAELMEHCFELGV